MQPVAPTRSTRPFAIGALAGVSALGLLALGAIAPARLALAGRPRYSVSVPLAPRSAKHIAGRAPHVSRIRVAAGEAALLPPDDVNVARPPLGTSSEDLYIERAMRTGQLQEWLGVDGQRRFLNVGPEQEDGDRYCRDMVMLIRRADGRSETRSSRRCLTDRVAKSAPVDAGDGGAPSAAATPVTDLPSSEHGAMGASGLTAGR